MRPYAALLILLFLAATKGPSQNPVLVDSLAHLADIAPNDSARAEYYDQLCDYLSAFDNEKRGYYARKMLAISERQNPDGTTETLLPQAHPRALYHMGLYHYQRNEYPEALRCFYAAQPLYEQQNLPRGQAAIQSCIAKVYVEMEQWSDAERYFLLSKATYESVPFNKGVRSVLVNMGHMYGTRNDTDKALEYYLQAEKTFTDPNDRYAMSTVYSNIGYCYRLKKQTALARAYFEKAAAEFQRSGERDNLALLKFNLGDLWYEEGRWINALDNYQQGLESSLASQRNEHIQRGYNQLARTYLQLGEAARTLTEKDSLYLLAFDYNQKAREYGDSILGRERYEQLAEIQVRFETERKEHEISQLSTAAKAREIALLKQEVELRQRRLEAATAREQAALLEQSNTRYQLDLEINAARLREQNTENQHKQQALELLNKEYALREKEALRERTVSWGLKIGLAVFALLLLVLARLLWQKNRASQAILRQNREILRQQREIEDQNQKLEEASRFKSLFLSNMSHEIRTPLNTIINVSRLLDGTPLNTRQQEYVQAVEQSSQNLLALITDILDLSKIEAGKVDLRTSTCDVRAMLEQQVRLLRYNITQPDLQLVLDCDNKVPELVRTDPGRLGQILLNLLGNALKFTESGVITLSCTVREQISATKAVLEFAVQDTGIGIPPDKLEHIFDAFAQAEADTHVRFGGTGLGLAICKQLIEIQGGTLGVESAVGKGSTFRFTLPVEIAPQPNPTELASPVLHKLPGMKILLVEDNPFNRMLALELLEKIVDNPGITLAENGAEALEKTAESTFDLILMDIRMPVMDGIDATKAIRKTGVRAPIMALTANALTEEEQRCREAGMDDYLSKPIDLGLLRDKIAFWTQRN